MKAAEPDQDLLSSLRIAAPCNVSWESMTGDNRVRHCDQCDKNVYNISSMTKGEANEFLQATAYKACVNFYQRSDGTILTDNCPVGLRKLRAQYKKIAAAAGTIISLASGIMLSVFAGEPVPGKPNSRSPVSTLGRTNNFRGEPTTLPERTGGQPLSNMRGAPAVSPQRTGGDPTPMGGMPAPLPPGRLGGEPTLGGKPVAMPDSESVKKYKAEVSSRLSAGMPKTNLGHAAVSFIVDHTGHVNSIKLINPSPSKKTDELIIQAINHLKLPVLPNDCDQTGMFMYYECQKAKK